MQLIVLGHAPVGHVGGHAPAQHGRRVLRSRGHRDRRQRGEPEGVLGAPGRAPRLRRAPQGRRVRLVAARELRRRRDPRRRPRTAPRRVPRDPARARRAPAVGGQGAAPLPAASRCCGRCSRSRSASMSPGSRWRSPGRWRSGTGSRCRSGSRSGSTTRCGACRPPQGVPRYHVRYEDLDADPVGTLDQLLAWLEAQDVQGLHRPVGARGHRVHRSRAPPSAARLRRPARDAERRAGRAGGRDRCRAAARPAVGAAGAVGVGVGDPPRLRGARRRADPRVRRRRDPSPRGSRRRERRAGRARRDQRGAPARGADGAVGRRRAAGGREAARVHRALAARGTSPSA